MVVQFFMVRGVGSSPSERERFFLLFSKQGIHVILASSSLEISCIVIGHGRGTRGWVLMEMKYVTLKEIATECCAD